MSADSPLLSVVVSSYNQGRFIRDCIESILSQGEVEDFEIVIVDDASKDDTADIVNTFREPRLRLIQHRRNTGLVSTLNDGFAHSRGAYIARIDADDRYRPWFLAETVRVLDNSPEVGLVYGDVAAIDESGNLLADPWGGVSSRQAHAGQRYQGNEYLALIEDNFVPAPTVLARRRTWAAAAPIPDWVFHSFPATDWYLNLRMARRHEFCYLPVTLAEYRLHASNWHRKVGADPRVEVTVLRILAEIFTERACGNLDRRVRRRVYARAYTRFAASYLAAGQWSEASRCYLRASLYQPTSLRSPAVLRGIVTALLGRPRYEAWKRLYRRTLEFRSSGLL